MSQETIIYTVDLSDEDTIEIEPPRIPPPPIDLFAHLYKPTSIADLFTNHQSQAEYLKDWIETRNLRGQKDSDSTYSDSVHTSCIIINGPPGVGKTSLVYAVANQIGMHVIEFNPSQKRDSTTVKKLKLANQETGFGILPFKQSYNVSTSSIILLDDAETLLEHDASFWSSMVPFIENSKRPVILTVTQAIDKVNKLIPGSEVLILQRPESNEFKTLLDRICARQSFTNLIKNDTCRHLVRNHDDDIRQSINRLQFFADNPKSYINDSCDRPSPMPALYTIDLNSDDVEISNRQLMDTYSSANVLDVLESKFSLLDRKTLLSRWLNSQPSCRSEEPGFADRLATDIRDSIIESMEKVCLGNVMSDELIEKTSKTYANLKKMTQEAARIIDSNIKSRVIDEDSEFYTDVGPYVSDIISSDYFRRLDPACRRVKRFLHYFDANGVFLDNDQQKLVTHLFGHENREDLISDTYSSLIDEKEDDIATDTKKKKPKRKRRRLN